MNLYLTAATKTKDVVIDFIEVRLESGKVVSLNWEESEITLTAKGFEAVYKGVCFDESDADERIAELKNFEIVDVQLYSETESNPSITIEEMTFEDFFPTTLTYRPHYNGGSHE